MKGANKDSDDIVTDEILFAGNTRFDVAAVGAANKPWNRTLCGVNNAWVRLGVVEGDFHWHKHDDADEFFMVLQGQFDIELKDRTVTLMPSQAFTVTKGIMHFPHAHARVVALWSSRPASNQRVVDVRER